MPVPAHLPVVRGRLVQDRGDGVRVGVLPRRLVGPPDGQDEVVHPGEGPAPVAARAAVPDGGLRLEGLGPGPQVQEVAATVRWHNLDLVGGSSANSLKGSLTVAVVTTTSISQNPSKAANPVGDYRLIWLGVI